MVVARLFSDDFQDVSSKLELDRVIACHPEYDPYYITSGCIADRRRGFEDLWEVYYPYVDSHFLQQHKSNFHQRTWEMYLGAVLLKHGFVLAPPRDHGPNFKVISPVPTWIEAVAPRAGNGSDAVPAPVIPVGNHPEDQLLLRLTNLVEVKSGQ